MPASHWIYFRLVSFRSVLNAASLTAKPVYLPSESGGGRGGLEHNPSMALN